MEEKKRIPAGGIDLGTTFLVIASIDGFGLPRTILNSDGDTNGRLGIHRHRPGTGESGQPDLK